MTPTAVLDFHTLTEDGAEHDIATVRLAPADEFSPSEADQTERIPGRQATTLQDRVG
jgi:hypothetical protein